MSLNIDDSVCVNNENNPFHGKTGKIFEITKKNLSIIFNNIKVTFNFSDVKKV